MGGRVGNRRSVVSVKDERFKRLRLVINMVYQRKINQSEQGREDALPVVRVVVVGIVHCVPFDPHRPLQ